MEFSEGDIVTGKVTGIAKFGALLRCRGINRALCISQISMYNIDIRDCLTEGQTVR